MPPIRAFGAAGPLGRVRGHGPGPSGRRGLRPRIAGMARSYQNICGEVKPGGRPPIFAFPVGGGHAPDPRL